jgi:hypothetical protein
MPHKSLITKRGNERETQEREREKKKGGKDGSDSHEPSPATDSPTNDDGTSRVLLASCRITL